LLMGLEFEPLPGIEKTSHPMLIFEIFDLIIPDGVEDEVKRIMVDGILSNVE